MTLATKTNEKVEAGRVYRNSNGSDYACILAKGDYALFQQLDLGRPKYIVAWEPALYDHGDGQLKLAWQQGHYHESFGGGDAGKLLSSAMKDFNERTRGR